MNKNCLSHWYPILQRTGVRTPDTLILDLGEDGWNLAGMLDGDDPGEPLNRLTSFINDCGESLGYPMFLRTGLTSGKHSWEKTCYLTSPQAIQQHVYSLVEFSHLAHIMGLSHNVWVCRRMIATAPLFRCVGYGNMPVVHERRWFIRDGKLQCSHPYWPKKALSQGRPDRHDWILCMDELSVQFGLEAVAKVAGGFDGYWSVDVLKDESGDVWVTDMALGADSYHAPECEYSNETRNGATSPPSKSDHD
jgi:hypothetical protein